MPIRFVCPFGHPLIVPDERAGKRGRCPVCRQRLIIPTPDKDSPALERLPWKREWRDEEISVDEAAAAATAPADSTLESGHALGDGGDSAAAPVSVAAAPVTAASPSWSDAWANLAAADFQYPLDSRRAWRARLLAVMLAALAVFSAAPAAAYFDVARSPPWCWLVLISSGLLGLGAVGALSLPDWSTLWCAAWTVGIVGCGYFIALSTAIVAPADRPLPLGLDMVRSSAAGWSGVMVLLCGALGYANARMSSSWRRDYEAARCEWHRRRESPMSTPTETSTASTGLSEAPKQGPSQATTPRPGPPQTSDSATA
ncbi:MAG: hypothetical protein AB7U73_04625 [Pirellulales bacterium]